MGPYNRLRCHIWPMLQHALRVCAAYSTAAHTTRRHSQNWSPIGSGTEVHAASYKVLAAVSTSSSYAVLSDAQQQLPLLVGLRQTVQQVHKLQENTPREAQFGQESCMHTTDTKHRATTNRARGRWPLQHHTRRSPARAACMCASGRALQDWHALCHEHHQRAIIPT